VLSDRFPSSSIGKMDSPRIPLDGDSIYIRFLGRLERRFYNTIVKPDLLIELYVPIEVALERNRHRIKNDKESESELRQRYLENSNLRYDVKEHVKIENSQDFAQANAQILNIVWKSLQ